jgi:photosystem II stability/assembly factor-like uncharacterized protein
MPDLDSKLTAMGTRLRDSVRTPDIVDVIEHSNRRTARHRTQLITVVLVALVAMAVPLLRAGVHDQQQPAAKAPTPEQRLDWSRMVDFFDTTHGFSVLVHCPEMGHCAGTLQVTEDGRTWRRANLPRDGSFVIAGVLGPKALLVDSLPDNLRWFSDDAGDTWQHVSRLPEGTTDSIPAGAMLEIKCTVLADGDCQQDRVLVVSPATGKVAALATQPPIYAEYSQRIPDADGTWWVFGTASGAPALAASRDQGRSWQVSALPSIESATSRSREVKVFAGPGALYAVVVDVPDNGDLRMTAILRSTDAGGTWESTWKAEDGRQPATIVGDLQVLADGKLLMHSSSYPTDKVYTSTNAGRTFIGGVTGTAAGIPLWTNAGYLTAPLTVADTEPYTYRLSIREDTVSGEIPLP